MSRPELLSLTLKGLLAWLVLSCLVLFFGEGLITNVFPLLKAVMISMTPDLSPSLHVVKSVQSQMDASIELSVLALRPIYLNADHFIPPTTELKSSAHLLHSFVPLVIEGSILLVWPVQHWRQRVLLLGSGLLTAILVVMATLPAQLLGKLEISFQDIAELGMNPRQVPWFVDWMVFCELGGRWLLGITAAWLCIQLQRTFLRI
ncbi:hypothetical protein [Methylomonas methanica]|uniref:Uncharacterized protein n=1 Tax=Methylomonas methanica (strain DSM 25384 / MC09) TaxID=857087 RepID=F9ZYZ9_METMM|nr:hypothetical protein [Methylomonas methanica]AEF99854.1 hypothetical protein Metme_1431 [Methylomonas methanica MC09]